MALSPYRDRNSSFYRSRSSSLSSPTSRNFVYQEVYEIGSNALVRSFSCGQVFGRDKNGQTIQATQVQISNFISPVKSLVQMGKKNRSSSVPKKLPIVYHEETKPMKARTSLQFSETDTMCESVADGGNTISHRLIYLIWRNMKRTFYINLVILTILSACYMYRYNYCNQHWDTRDIVHKLQQSLFGQEVALSKIRTILTKFEKSVDSSVMCFTGSAGVGKTFASSIIYDNFPWVSNEYIDFFDSNTEEMLRTKKYSSCGVNLVVVDGIDTSFAETALKSVKYLIGNNESAKFIVILIFKTHNKDEEDVVLEGLKNSDGRFYYVQFRDLEQQEIKKCFSAELKRQNKFISQEKFNELLINHMKFCNISQSFQGCKNVFHEVSRLP